MHMSEPRDATKADDERSVIGIVPAHNEADQIEDVLRDAREYVDKLVVVDDGSSDDTVAIAREHADGVVTHPNNMGVGASLHTGYQVAIREGYDLLVQIDADGQHDPAYIPELLETMEREDADMVIGSRWLNDSYRDFSLLRRLGIRFFTFEANLLGDLDITDVTSGFRVYDVSMLDDLGVPERTHPLLEQTLEVARKGYSVTEYSVPMPPEKEGSMFDLETYLLYPPRMALITLKVLLFR